MIYTHESIGLTLNGNEKMVYQNIHQNVTPMIIRLVVIQNNYSIRTVLDCFVFIPFSKQNKKTKILR